MFTFKPRHVAQCQFVYSDGSVCPRLVTQKQYDFSIKKYGKPVCWGHQKQIDLKTLCEKNTSNT